MKKELADKLRLEYTNLWDESMTAIPDGWITPLVTMLDKLYALSDVERSMSYQAEGLATWVDIRIEVTESCAAAYICPLKPAGKWNGARALACVDALSEFAGQTAETCSVCGEPGILRLPNIGNGVEGVLCDEHNSVAQSASLYKEFRDLFPPVQGKSINLDLPNFLVEPVANALRVILRLVIREGIVGKVLITRLECDRDCLFTRVRYYEGLTDDHLGTKASINSMIGDLEAEADRLCLNHNREGGSDATS